ncbi:MAG: glucoamylase family protein [Candidatus Peribacteraceae bacterium]|nr:glucoamylase family protein [Candidatus Peribacteraceae bacterium]
MERSPPPERLPRRDFLRGTLGGAVGMFGFPAAAEGRESAADLDRIERDCLLYFLENRTEEGLFADRQRNRGERYDLDAVPCSLSATGMGLIALAVAAQKPHRLLTPSEASERCGQTCDTARGKLPQDHGVLPHYVKGKQLAVWGDDARSTVETAWLVAGAGCAAELLHDDALREAAAALHDRVDWRYWSCKETGMLLHGKNGDGDVLPGRWDRLNNETAFMYVLAAGAEGNKRLDLSSWKQLGTFDGEVAGVKFASADLGLFAHQYGFDLLHLREWKNPGSIDLLEQARLATRANILASQAMSKDFSTFRTGLWGLSAGDGPSGPDSAYRIYTPRSCDGTAHVMSSVASIAHDQAAVLRNLLLADDIPNARGRYGYGNINLENGTWVSGDVVGIDVGAALLALDNHLHDDRIRHAFHAFPPVQRGLKALGFRRRRDLLATDG